MARLIILAEGPTERDFINLVLMPHLQDYGIFVASPRDMGGNVSLQRMVYFLRPLLHSFDYVSTLVDYYGFKATDNHQWTTVEELEALLQKSIGNQQNFIPYIQKYEYEGLLFSAPDKITDVLRQPDKLTELLVISKQFAPEDINGNPNTCPAARLTNIFGRAYSKVQHGPDIAQRIGLETLRAACPRFHQWITQLESLQ
jgi:hypothetical protein